MWWEAAFVGALILAALVAFVYWLGRSYTDPSSCAGCAAARPDRPCALRDAGAGATRAGRPVCESCGAVARPCSQSPSGKGAWRGGAEGT